MNAWMIYVYEEIDQPSDVSLAPLIWMNRQQDASYLTVHISTIKKFELSNYLIRPFVQLWVIIGSYPSSMFFNFYC